MPRERGVAHGGRLVAHDVSAVTVWSFEETLTSHSKGIITMTALHIVDPASVLAEALTDASPDLMRSLLQTAHPP